MPNKHAAEKDLRKNQRRATRNARLKTHVKHLAKSVHELSTDGKKADAKTVAAKLQQAADKAAKHGIISRAAAGRKKSLAMKATA
jgi:ribosomal protein S20